MADTSVLGRLYLREIDTQLLGALAHCRSSEHLGLCGGFGCRARFGLRCRIGIGCQRIIRVRRIGSLDLDPFLDRFRLGSGRRCRLGSGLAFFGNVVGHFALNLDHHEHRPDRDHVALAAGDLEDLAGHRAFHRHGRLVGHHVDEFLVFIDRVTDLLVPLHDFGLGDAFADIGHVEGKFRHGDQSLRILSMASPMRIGPGK